MSELIQKNDNRATIRWKLLTGASALALTAYVSAGAPARAEDSGQPQVWIELGTQLNRTESLEELFSPAIMAARPSIFAPSDEFEGQRHFRLDEEAKISFQPDNSNWVLSASVRFGRSTTGRHNHQATHPSPHRLYYLSSPTAPLSWPPGASRYADTQVQNSERHLILDFQAGKDVGLGMFGSSNGTSVLGAGVRFAQFTARSNIALKSDPDWHFVYTYNPSYVIRSSLPLTGSKAVLSQPYHNNLASLRAQRSFRGIGPSISWSASMPFAGNEQAGELTLDWSLNAAVLFGRQKAKVHHQTTARSGVISAYGHNRSHTTPTQISTDHTRSRNVAVPNLGGSVGFSWRLPDANAKLSIGYRYDTFLDAMDIGIDATKKSNVTFNGPFASISIGIGD